VLSMTEKQLEIKPALLGKLDEVAGLVSTAVEEDWPAHRVEQQLWKQLLAFGHQVLGIFFSNVAWVMPER